MLKLLAGAVVYLLLLAIIYLAFAFIEYDFNPAHWDGFLRFVGVLCAGAAFILVTDAVSDSDDDGEE